MKKLITIAVLLVLIPIISALLVERVPPGVIGVRQGMWGSGYEQKDYMTGFRLGVTGYHKWHYLPRKTHFIHFTESNPTGRVNSLIESWNQSLNIRTRDNNPVLIDVSVAYKISDGFAWQIVQKGQQANYTEKLDDVTRSVLRIELGKLSSEDLQSTELRLQMVEQILPLLTSAMGEYFCEANSMLIRKIGFPPDYEAQLQEKQYLRQKAKLDQAQTLLAEEEKTVNMIDMQIGAAERALEEDWNKRIQEKMSEYQVVIAQIKADADVYASRTVAQGEAERVIAEANGKLAVEKAEALRNELRTAALNSEGGHILLGLEAATNLQIPTVTLNSDDPAVPMILDLSKLTSLLVGKSD